MAKTFEETFDECLSVLKREFIIFGADAFAFTELQLQTVAILVRGGVTARDFGYAISSNLMEYVDDDEQWRDVFMDAILRRADINSEIAEAQS